METAQNNIKEIAFEELYNQTVAKGLNSYNVEKMYKALRSISGIEAWIGDREMKEHFQKTVYGALESAKL